MAWSAPEREQQAISAALKIASVEEAFAALSAAAPEGWGVEQIEGEIHVAAPADGEHAEIVAEVADQVSGRRKDAGLRTRTGLGLNVPGVWITGKVTPDLVIAPKRSFGGRLKFHDPSPVMLVGEVTSESTADRDRGPKLRGYARVGIPLYLLVDREAHRVTLYSEPAGDRYTRESAVAFSKTIALPAPFDFEIDTSQF
ncbi:Uma2 family endonuclease [Streptomyces sp. NRRL F-5755]|uniref:Uma2 family endonuclease n=1 Tax=Streptomyces sp. NRRL F-5755 TaxID=1519475 RepID=UPI0006ADF8C3|nr:Uma2 family endonuclease [Streptomyces sp. NRRL F-5755]